MSDPVAHPPANRTLGEYIAFLASEGYDEEARFFRDSVAATLRIFGEPNPEALGADQAIKRLVEIEDTLKVELDKITQNKKGWDVELNDTDPSR